MLLYAASKHSVDAQADQSVRWTYIFSVGMRREFYLLQCKTCDFQSEILLYLTVSNQTLR